MIKITDNATFRQGYEWLSFISKHHEDAMKIQGFEADLKREIRKWAHRPKEVNVGLGFMVERRLVHDNGIDGYVELIRFPEGFDTEESAKDFFKEFIEVECLRSAYDCTGQPFTGWYKLFRRHGRFHAYHCVCYDV